MKWIACTRMYDVTPTVRRHWQVLLQSVASRAGIEIDCIDYAPPAPLAQLWARDDLALTFVCGFPLATRYPGLRPLAAPVTVMADGGRPTYRSVWIVRAESVFDTLASTFGHRIGWTIEHSHSGFNAPRFALLRQRNARRPRLYSESVGPLGHPRAVLAALAEGRIDVSALDAYWWWLCGRHDPELAARFRTIGETEAAPMPPLASAAGLPEASATQLAAALVALSSDPDARPHLEALGVDRFAAVTRSDYAPLATLARAALDAGYPVPA